MSREIKFRAFYGRMYQVIAWDGFKQNKMNGEIGCVTLIDEEGNCFAEAIKNIELMQYTGARDRKGKEIWEDDIVMLYGLGDPVKLKIVYQASSQNMDFCGELLEDGRHQKGTLYHVSPEIAEVIGNIYENPELIK